MKRWLIYAGLAGAALAGLWVWRRGGLGNVGRAAGAGAVEAAAGAAAGAVEAIGKTIGIPRTSSDACMLALAEGRTWDASFACPAGTFIGSLFGAAPPPVDQTIMDRWDYQARAGSAANGQPEGWLPEPGDGSTGYYP